MAAQEILLGNARYRIGFGAIPARSQEYAELKKEVAFAESRRPNQPQ